MGIKITGSQLPNIPWENRRQGNEEILWRSEKNPIIPRNLIKISNSIFNSAVVPFKDQFAGVFRCDDQCRRMNIHKGFSSDGINWKIDEEPIVFQSEYPEALLSDYKYDPRVTQIEQSYYISWCNGYHGPTIGLARTDDFKNFHQLENAFLPFNRNGVLFPRKINNHYVMLSRPSDSGHTPFGDIFISQSPDLTYWGKHRHVMGPKDFKVSAWQCTKIGAGPVPIETTEGWLIFYHGVLTSCNGFVYSMGAALLDLEEPWKVIYRNNSYLLSPQTIYECAGDVPNVVFPCAALADSDTGKIAIYYGAADTVTGLAFGQLEEIFDFLKKDS
ncbi:MAG: glycoside hydrolase family 130 protein [Spirochaetes bacterium]|nr:glycoside hydrolase family 130 protein [Spirochaetota bacterium]